LERGHVLAGSALEVHPEPDRPQHQADDPRRDVLRNLDALLVCKLLDFYVVRLNFRGELRAARGLILRLHGCDWLRVATRAAHQRDAKHRDH
jgi:hypothetical protein